MHVRVMCKNCVMHVIKMECLLLQLLEIIITGASVLEQDLFSSVIGNGITRSMCTVVGNGYEKRESKLAPDVSANCKGS